MKAVFISPYLDTLGGGERYLATAAKVLADEGFDVDLEWGDKGIMEKLENKFGLDLKNINVVADGKKGEGYDVCFWVSDGSIPYLHARKNILHFQVPFSGVNGNSLINKMKMYRVSSVVVNSEFTKKVVDKEYGIKSIVIYPPVDVEKIRAKRKENIICYVGRFSKLKQIKGHDVLLKVFKSHQKSFANFKLVLAGGTEVGSDEYLEDIKKSALGYPVQILENPSWKEVKELYGKSKYFFSAAGYQVNESKEPEKMEHFGMTVVESMAAKCVPLVYKGGGFPEIVKDGVNGFLWEDLKELVARFKALEDNRGLCKKISENTRLGLEKFAVPSFRAKLLEVV